MGTTKWDEGASQVLPLQKGGWKFGSGGRGTNSFEVVLTQDTQSFSHAERGGGGVTKTFRPFRGRYFFFFLGGGGGEKFYSTSCN